MQVSLIFAGKRYEHASQGMKEVANTLQQAWGGSAKIVRGDLLRYLNSVASELATRHSSPYPGGGDNKLSVRSGRGVQSIIRSVTVSGSSWATLTGGIGGRSSIMIHEFGATVKGKNKLLTIPLPAALNSRGMAPPFSRQWKDTFVMRSKAGNLIVFQRRGREIVPLYVLKPSVYIPPRLGMGDELEDQLPYFLQRAADTIAAHVAAELRSAKSAG